MIGKRWLLSGIMAGLAILASVPASAGDIKITIPRHSKLTPVQRLNREGVEAIRQHKYSKAESLFYKAYLLDPDDPFTLNNLGYISEMQGEIDRAQRFYSLAAEQSSDAVIDRSALQRNEPLQCCGPCQPPSLELWCDPGQGFSCGDMVAEIHG